MSFATKPTFVKQAFANNGIKNTIPDTTANVGYASYNEGFPAITMQPKESGGLPPRGQDMNGILNELSQFNQYQQMGGTYGLDNNILINGGYAKNSIVYQDDGIYRSLVDNNTDDFVDDPSVIGSTWQLIVDYNTNSGSNGVPGQLSPFFRTDAPTGWLRCDGTQYTKSSFPDFWDDYLTQNKMPTCSYAEYATEISDNNGNCGKFAVDLVNLTFKVPTIQGQVFISQALVSGDIGKFNAESLPNIKGTARLQGADVTQISGCFKSADGGTGGQDGGGPNRVLLFDANKYSSVYQDNAINQPNNIQFPIFVCVANKQVPVSEAQYNGFISNLTQKVDLDGSNATFNNLSTTAKNNIKTLGNPDWSRAVSINVTAMNINDTYTFTEDGILYIFLTSGNNIGYISLKSSLDSSQQAGTYFVSIPQNNTIALEYRVQKDEIITLKQKQYTTLNVLLLPLK